MNSLTFKASRSLAMGVLFLTTFAIAVGSTANAKDGVFEVLFDGKSLAGWEGNPELWSVVDGAILGQTDPAKPLSGNTFLIWNGEEIGDFDFRCKVRFEGNNTGVMYRSDVTDAAGFVMAGNQADLHPKAEYFGMLYSEKTGRGIVATRGQKVQIAPDGKKKVVGKVGDDSALVDQEWNDLRIVAVGNRVIHQVNGITTVDVTDRFAGAKQKGRIGLQLHAGPAMKAEFRGLLLRQLTDADRNQVLAQAIKDGQPAPAKVSDEGALEVPPASDSSWLTDAPAAHWVWAAEHKNNQKVWFRRGFELAGKARTARLYASCDNQIKLWLNGKEIGVSDNWAKPIELDVTKALVVGKNQLAVEGQNEGGIAGLVLKLVITNQDGSKFQLVTDDQWKLTGEKPTNWLAAEFDDSAWQAVNVSKKILGEGPWGIPNYSKSGSDSGQAADPLAAKNIMSPPGFVVERIYAVPKEQGSWVALTVDPQGRLYACDQQDKGLYRITMAAEGQGDPKVEKVDVSFDGEPLKAAQGLLWAFDALWFHRNGGHLYRLTDTNGDDRLDTAEQIAGGTGGGEHGNHGLVVTEDGNAIYMDGGNHAPLGELAGSRVPTWDEDLLLPRMWDANGHARGKLAPGGWVTRLDPKTLQQTLHTIGFRNQYDIDLNRNGDLFTYDADMEWDLGLPWYRPTRICHVVSGADYGWRSGSGKWPAYYEDSLPPVVDIGPGSPTGVVSGEGTDFPTKYQDAIYALDWTFGTIYAIHLKATGAGYTGVAEPFVYGAPLPVTDAIVGKDGSLYFTVGGRGAKSGLFRVRYVGDASKEAPTATDPKAVAARESRRQLEAFHGKQDPAAVAAAMPFLASPDRFLRHAARVAIESQPVDSWREQVLASSDAQTQITGTVALARMGEETDRDALLASLNALDLETLSDSQLLGALRAYALAFIRLGSPTAEERAAVIAKLDPMLPHRSDDVNTELIRVLVKLRAPGVVAKVIPMIVDREPTVFPDWSDLASRNRGYGARIQELMKNPPPAREIQYAFMLRSLRSGWTLEQRRAYFTFLNEAAKASGGASYPGYLTRIRDEALGNCSNAERTALQDITGESFDPEPDFEIAPVKGPGKVWDVQQAVQAVRGKPNFERGRSLFFAAKCASCHRMGGLGGTVGPDLTSIPNKFDTRYVIEAIVDPSKDISDQYGSSVVLLDSGQIVTGLVVTNQDAPEGAGQLVVYPSDPDAKPITVDAETVEEINPSPISQMPKELLDSLSPAEVNDLLQYLMSAGNPEDKRYQ